MPENTTATLSLSIYIDCGDNIKPIPLSIYDMVSIYDIFVLSLFYYLLLFLVIWYCYDIKVVSISEHRHSLTIVNNLSFILCNMNIPIFLNFNIYKLF